MDQQQHHPVAVVIMVVILVTMMTFIFAIPIVTMITGMAILVMMIVTGQLNTCATKKSEPRLPFFMSFFSSHSMRDFQIHAVLRIRPQDGGQFFLRE